jgi:putative CocE/NonD family hydrolase
VLYPAPGHALAESASTQADGGDDYQADYACGTGVHTRYDRLYLASIEAYYDDWDGREDAMLSYTGEPLAADLEVTGHPAVQLAFTCSQKDCAFFVYLSDVTAQGRSVYVTEGVFRALHRAPGALPERIPATGPQHSFKRADAKLLTPGEPDTAAFELLPTSYLFRKGHRVRLSIALSDSDHFTRIPDGRPPRITLLRNAAHATRLMLPVVRS